MRAAEGLATHAEAQAARQQLGRDSEPMLEVRPASLTAQTIGQLSRGYTLSQQYTVETPKRVVQYETTISSPITGC